MRKKGSKNWFILGNGWLPMSGAYSPRLKIIGARRFDGPTRKQRHWKRQFAQGARPSEQSTTVEILMSRAAHRNIWRSRAINAKEKYHKVLTNAFRNVYELKLLLAQARREGFSNETINYMGAQMEKYLWSQSDNFRFMTNITMNDFSRTEIFKPWKNVTTPLPTSEPYEPNFWEVYANILTIGWYDAVRKVITGKSELQFPKGMDITNFTIKATTEKVLTGFGGGVPPRTGSTLSVKTSAPARFRKRTPQEIKTEFTGWLQGMSIGEGF